MNEKSFLLSFVGLACSAYVLATTHKNDNVPKNNGAVARFNAFMDMDQSHKELVRAFFDKEMTLPCVKDVDANKAPTTTTVGP